MTTVTSTPITTATTTSGSGLDRSGLPLCVLRLQSAP